MSGSAEKIGGGETGVLAARRGVAEANHPRVADPTAATVLARLAHPAPPVVAPTATVLDALQLMTERDVSAVAVVAPSGLLGLFSERDHARDSLLGNRTPQNTPVVDLMNRDVATAAPTTPLGACLSLLDAHGTTHLAVVDAGRLVGLLSKDHLATAMIAHHERIFHEGEMDRNLLFLRGTYSC